MLKIHGKNLNERNLLAFAYFKSGKIDEARNELTSLIEETGNFTAYRQLVHLEKCQGNIEDAKIWTYECIDKFPQNVKIREELISIAREEGDIKEIAEQLREIIKINPENTKNRERTQIISSIEEREL